MVLRIAGEPEVVVNVVGLENHADYGLRLTVNGVAVVAIEETAQSKVMVRSVAFNSHASDAARVVVDLGIPRPPYTNEQYERRAREIADNWQDTDVIGPVLQALREGMR